MSKNKSKKDAKVSKGGDKAGGPGSEPQVLPPASELQVLSQNQAPQQMVAPPLMLPQTGPIPRGQNAPSGVSGLMSNLVGGGQPADDQLGLLDNPHNGDPGRPTNENPQSRIRGNQDLWLLNMFFKGCAFLVYFFLPIVFPKALSYILVLMLTSIDFWVVKNIVGRKLIKMRWWFIIDDQGNERWHYESKEHPILFQDKLVFWGSLYAFPLVWVVFCVMNALTIQIFDTATTFVCALINAVQWWGFKNCKNAHERKMKIIRRRQANRGRRPPPGAVGPNMQPMREMLLPPGVYPPPPNGRMPPQQNNQQYRQ